MDFRGSTIIASLWYGAGVIGGAALAGKLTVAVAVALFVWHNGLGARVTAACQARSNWAPVMGYREWWRQSRVVWLIGAAYLVVCALL